MKNLTLILLTLCLFAVLPATADTYKASMTGIECSGCKKKILKAIGSMEGVETVKIALLKKKGSHVLTVETDGTVEISEEQVKEAVSIAEHYQLQTWEKVES
ncbi:MAG: heavy-metal-associated domain-containing protein [Verrucomicrobiales bacterium]|nr:heavy-metal-associated domain-containing protein [Verrucomicrobiales bacterium]